MLTGYVGRHGRGLTLTWLRGGSSVLTSSEDSECAYSSCFSENATMAMETRPHPETVLDLVLCLDSRRPGLVDQVSLAYDENPCSSQAHWYPLARAPKLIAHLKLDSAERLLGQICEPALEQGRWIAAYSCLLPP